MAKSQEQERRKMPRSSEKLQILYLGDSKSIVSSICQHFLHRRKFKCRKLVARARVSTSMPGASRISQTDKRQHQQHLSQALCWEKGGREQVGASWTDTKFRGRLIYTYNNKIYVKSDLKRELKHK